MPDRSERVSPGCTVLVRQRGLALVAVLWAVAALTLIVTGLVYAVRTQVRAVALQKELVVAGAIADAADVVAVRDLMSSKARTELFRSFALTIEGTTIQVQIEPLTGLIDLNAADESLLVDLLEVVGGLERGPATTIAQRILDWRDPDDAARPFGAENAAYIAAESPFRTRGGPFEAPEDLMQVLGMDYELYVKLRRLVTVHQRGNGRVSPAAAPLPVLRVLARGDERVAADYANARASLGTLADTTRFPSAHIGQLSTFRYVIQASVPLTSGASLVTRKVVDVSARQEAVPWATLFAERAVVAADEAQ